MTPEEIVEFAEGLARVAASGGGAKALANYLAERTQAGVLVEDAEWKRIASAGKAPLPASAREGSDACTQTVAVGSTKLGHLSALAADPTLVRLTAAAIAVELAREHDGGRGRRRTFWERLLARAYHDQIAARDDAAARGIACASQYVAVVLEPELSEDTNAAAHLADLRAAASDAFRPGEGDLGILDHSALLVLLVPVAREVDAENVRTAASLLPKALAKRKNPLRVNGGVGSVESLLSTARSFERAQTALTIARTIFGSGHVSAYDDLGAYPLLLHGANAEALQTFAASVLAPIRTYDEKHQTDLERTLRLYFSTGQNVKTAAADLNVHRHTVFYRLRQIADITGRSLESAHDQLTLRLAIAIDALHTE